MENYSIQQKGKFQIESNLVRHIAAYETEVFFSMESGLYRFDKGTRLLSKISLFENSMDERYAPAITFCHKDKKGRLWVSKKNGLYIREEGEKLRLYNTESTPALSNNRIRSIYPYSDSLMLIGTSMAVSYTHLTLPTICSV